MNTRQVIQWEISQITTKQFYCLKFDKSERSGWRWMMEEALDHSDNSSIHFFVLCFLDSVWTVEVHALEGCWKINRILFKILCGESSELIVKVNAFAWY